MHHNPTDHSLADLVDTWLLVFLCLLVAFQILILYLHYTFQLTITSSMALMMTRSLGVLLRLFATLNLCSLCYWCCNEEFCTILKWPLLQLTKESQRKNKMRIIRTSNWYQVEDEFKIYWTKWEMMYYNMTEYLFIASSKGDLNYYTQKMQMYSSELYSQ